VNVPVVAPFAITMPEGVDRFALLLLSETALHPDDALFSVTVHVLEEPAGKVEGTQFTVVGAMAETRLIVTAEELPRSAVTVAD
jgi:hypothetical protein